ncbi:MAG TPA: DUF4340 domain-containing protein [Candidatus Pullilachnospira intestinigallinarum]|nr:DUF4340 domain-containing protein [Candidatus Pullilachnospira intestinigallinarum]
MKKKRGLKIAGAILLLAVLIAVYLLLKNHNAQTEQEASSQEEESVEIAAVPAEDISRLTFEISGEDVSWVQKEDGWSLESDSNFPVDQDQMDHLTDQLASVKADRTLENVENLEEYGLNIPSNVIQVEETDGSSLTITIGNQNASTGDCYIYLNDDTKTVYTVPSALQTVFSGGLYNFAEGEDYPGITSSTISRVSVEKKENSYTLQTDDSSSTGWEVTGQKGDEKEADATEAGTLQSTIAGLSFDNYYEYNCQDLSLYGLDQPQAVITVDYTEQQEAEDTDTTEDAETDDADTSGEDAGETSDDTEAETVTVDKEMKLLVGNSADDGNYYVMIDGSPEVHGISQDSLDSLLQGRAFDYWKMSVSNMSISDLDYLEVTYEDETHVLKRVVTEEPAEDADSDSEDASSDADSGEDSEEQETKTVTTYYVDDQEVESQDFTSFYSAANSMTYQERLEKNDADGDEEFVLTYYDTAGNQIRVAYIPRDENFYVAADNDGNYGLVNKMTVTDLENQFAELLETAQAEE